MPRPAAPHAGKDGDGVAQVQDDPAGLDQGAAGRLFRCGGGQGEVAAKCSFPLTDGWPNPCTAKTSRREIEEGGRPEEIKKRRKEPGMSEENAKAA